MQDIHPLRTWRKQQPITLQALAAKLDISVSHLSEIECWHNVPSLPLAAKLAKETGLSINEFVRSREAAQ